MSAKRETFLELVRELVAEGRGRWCSRSSSSCSPYGAEISTRKASPTSTWMARRSDATKWWRKFQGGTAPLFLISLKAGGVGFNLTAADTVIHCDPWWNPAVEDQATDRTHRIGQDKPVTVVRLIARGTIEEKIRFAEIEETTPGERGDHQ